jgi:hypothetical protein
MTMNAKTRATAELAALLAREIALGHGVPDRTNPAPFMIADDAITLRRLGLRASRLAVQRCNGVERYDATRGGRFPDWTDEDEARAEQAEKRIKAAADLIAAQYSATASVGGDPRGYVLHLHLKSGTSNSMGGRESGWGVA